MATIFNNEFNKNVRIHNSDVSFYKDGCPMPSKIVRLAGKMKYETAQKISLRHPNFQVAEMNYWAYTIGGDAVNLKSVIVVNP